MVGNRDATLSLLEHKTGESANHPEVEEGAVRHGGWEKPRGPWAGVCWKGRPARPAGPRKVRSWRYTKCPGGAWVTSRATSSRAPVPSTPTRAHPRSSRRTGSSRHRGTQARGVTQKLRGWLPRARLWELPSTSSTAQKPEERGRGCR